MSSPTVFSRPSRVISEDLKASLINLQGLEFIYQKQLFPELEYIFKHALTQEVAYNTLLLKRRKEIHESIGKAIEELYSDRLEEYYGLLAHHFVRSDNKHKALKYLDLANRKAANAYAMVWSAAVMSYVYTRRRDVGRAIEYAELAVWPHNPSATFRNGSTPIFTSWPPTVLSTCLRAGTHRQAARACFGSPPGSP